MQKQPTTDSIQLKLGIPTLFKYEVTAGKAPQTPSHKGLHAKDSYNNILHPLCDRKDKTARYRP